jgi:transposase-like protein
VIAAEADGRGVGRVRLCVIQHPSAASLHPFIEDCVEPGSTVRTDGSQCYEGLKKKGYDHEVTSVQRRRPKEVSALLPRVHLVAALLKRWLASRHRSGVSREHLPYYLDEFTFRFNRRKSKSQGKLFFHLVKQAVNTGPATYAHIVKLPRGQKATIGATEVKSIPIRGPAPRSRIGRSPGRRQM